MVEPDNNFDILGFIQDVVNEDEAPEQKFYREIAELIRKAKDDTEKDRT